MVKETLEYKILLFEGDSNKRLFTRRPNGNFYLKDRPLQGNGATVEWMLKNNHHIFKIERLSDNQVFTIGDIVTVNNNPYNEIIKSFKLGRDKIWITTCHEITKMTITIPPGTYFTHKTKEPIYELW